MRPNPVLFQNCEAFYSPAPTKINKIRHSPDPVQSKSSPMLISDLHLSSLSSTRAGA